MRSKSAHVSIMSAHVSIMSAHAPTLSPEQAREGGLVETDYSLDSVGEILHLLENVCAVAQEADRLLDLFQCMRVCVSACVCACVCACVRACVRDVGDKSGAHTRESENKSKRTQNQNLRRTHAPAAGPRCLYSISDAAAP